MVALNLGVPAVMLGQGMESIVDLKLHSMSKVVLPFLDLIAIREKVYALQLLEMFGVDHSKIMVTGDDAIEMANDARRDKLGTGIGLSFRVISYTEIDEHHLEVFRDIIQKAASLYKAILIALPISHHVWKADNQAISQPMTGYALTWIGLNNFELPIEIIRSLVNVVL